MSYMNLMLFTLLSILISCSSPKSQNGGSSAAIKISTANSVPLNKGIHSACAVDIFFGKKFQPRDVLNDSYVSFLKEMNFTSLQYSGGSTSDFDHVIVGDTLITGGKGDGYNIREEDCKERGQEISTVLDGVGAVQFGKDFFNEYCALLHQLSIPGDIIANVQSGTIEELLWKIERSYAKRVIFGMEQNLGSNEQDFPDGNAYKDKVAIWIKQVREKYPSVKIVIDAAPVFSDKPKSVQWNQQIAGLPADEVRLYLWDKDLALWSDDAGKNLLVMDDAFEKTIPQWLELAQKKFPGKKVSVWQWGIKNKSAIANTMAACLYIGKFYEFVINYNRQHDDYIAFASFMSLKSLSRSEGDISNHAYALEAAGKLFSGNKLVDEILITGMPGVSGIACHEGGKFTLLLINESPAEYRAISLTADGKTLAPQSFSVMTVLADSPSSTSVAVNNDSATSLSLKPYSLTVVEF
ncbi:MAG: hypothetical protein JST18_09040 [Bacteroidetes bacterium]|nr:hypothetical protein [Bacteroidota bacterium]